MFKSLLLLLFSLLLPCMLLAQDADFSTYYEQSGYLKTPRYAETIEYCMLLDNASSILHYTTFGTSPQGRSLPLIIADKNENFTPEAVRKSGNAVILIEACIHAGESDGKDAGLILLRDIAILKKNIHLLDHVTILFIPILNVDGHERFGPYNRINQDGPEEMGWRTTAQNLNLNRDFIKCDAPEMQAWHILFNQWLPDFFVDCHVTDGADYQYALTYAIETGGCMDKSLSAWASDVFEPIMKQKMEKSSYPIFPYVQFRNWHDPRSGLVMGVAPPMLSQGYTAIQNRVGLLIETHMLKPYKTRVTANYFMLLHTLEMLNNENKTLLQLNLDADKITCSKQFRDIPFPVSFSEDRSDSTKIEFLGFDYTIDTSDLTGGLWFKYNKDKPTNWELSIFPKSIPTKQVMLPEAYLIPPQYSTVIDRLKLHGIEMISIQNDISIDVHSYFFKNVKFSQRSYEGHQKTNYELQDTVFKRDFPIGSMLVKMNQRTARVIAHALEPASPDSYAAWGFFNACMEQKEYSESYVMEKMAREMIAKNPALKREFDQKRASDKSLDDPDEMLNWFYSKTPYWDNQFNLYPVGRIMDAITLKKISSGAALK